MHHQNAPGPYPSTPAEEEECHCLLMNYATSVNDTWVRLGIETCDTLHSNYLPG